MMGGWAYLVLFQVGALHASCLLSPAAAFAGIQTFQRKATTATFSIRDNNHRNGQTIQPCPVTVVSLGARSADDEEEEGDPLMNDQREGMADAFSALDSLTANDFDDLRPLSSASDDTTASINDPRVFMEMQAELSTRGVEGVYDDILGDMTGGDPAVGGEPTSYLDSLQGDATGLGQALDQAVTDSPPLYDADGIGTAASTTADNSLTTADVSNDILTQEIKPSLSMEDFMTSAITEAVDEIGAASDVVESSYPGAGEAAEIAKTAEELLEDEELRRGIEKIFDEAGEKLRLEVAAMKREQEAVTQGASNQGLEYLESEKQRISEAEASVARLIQKVARETESVQAAMEDLESVKVSTEGGSGSIEDTALDLKKGGIVKQASLVGALLFGSRAVTETILVVGSPYGDQHFVPAILQAVIALACAAYFFLVK